MDLYVLTRCPQENYYSLLSNKKMSVKELPYKFIEFWELITITSVIMFKQEINYLFRQWLSGNAHSLVIKGFRVRCTT